MSLPPVINPYQPLVGLTGIGLNAGKLYIGIDGQDPDSYPQACFWDAAGTIPATQPIDVVGGYPYRLGTPTRLYTAATYSIRLRDRTGAQVFYEAHAVPGPSTADGVFTSVASAQGAVIPVPIRSTGLILLGYYSSGDGGGTTYRYATVQASGAGKFQSVDGAWWEMVNPPTDPRMLGARPVLTTDSTAAFQACLDLGGNILVPAGSWKLTSALTVSKTAQRIDCESGATLYPYFDGDFLLVTAADHPTLNIIVSGLHQPKSGALGAAVVIGYGGANARFCHVTGQISDWYGDAVRWEQGAFANFDGLLATKISQHGIHCTTSFDDNNHGMFVGCEMSFCFGRGYYIEKLDKTSNATTSSYDSRHHFFGNSKAYACAYNYWIESYSNSGHIYSEGSQGEPQRPPVEYPDQFPLCSRGNWFCYISDQTKYDNRVDAGFHNQFIGFGHFLQYEWSLFLANRLRVQSVSATNPESRYAGGLFIDQTADNTFRMYPGDFTGANAKIHFARGPDAAEATYVFDDRVQFPNSGTGLPLLVNDTYMGTVDVVCGTIASGAGVSFTLPAATVHAGSGDTAILTLTADVNFGIVVLHAIKPTGDIAGEIRNIGGSSIVVGTATIRWVVLKHFP